jgi:hypothetical protein
MSDQTNDFARNHLKVPGAKVGSRTVGHQLGTDGRELSAGAITPSQQEFLFPNVARTVALHTDQLEGDCRAGGLRIHALRKRAHENEGLQGIDACSI